MKWLKEQCLNFNHFICPLKAPISGAKSPIHNALDSTLPTTTAGFMEKCKQTGHLTAWPETPSHWVCTWMSSSSSLCLRALYRNIPRLLHASPGQTTVTAASPLSNGSSATKIAALLSVSRLSEEISIQVSKSTDGCCCHTDPARVKSWAISERLQPPKLHPLLICKKPLRGQMNVSETN